MSDVVSWHVELDVKKGQLENLRALTDEMVKHTKTKDPYETCANYSTHIWRTAWL
jgi:quinol monooxygenase YgiN